jgi:hypothetical protein
MSLFHRGQWVSCHPQEGIPNIEDADGGCAWSRGSARRLLFPDRNQDRPSACLLRRSGGTGSWEKVPMVHLLACGVVRYWILVRAWRTRGGGSAFWRDRFDKSGPRFCEKRSKMAAPFRGEHVFADGSWFWRSWDHSEVSQPSWCGGHAAWEDPPFAFLSIRAILFHGPDWEDAVGSRSILLKAWSCMSKSGPLFVRWCRWGANLSRDSLQPNHIH